MTRWWWETWLYKGRAGIGRVQEIGPAYEPGANPPDANPGAVGVRDVAAWIDHLEGLPPR
jgi:hypothetical protein